MTRVATGPAEAPDETRERERAYLNRLADESDEAVQVIDRQITGMQQTMAARQSEADDYRARAREMEA